MYYSIYYDKKEKVIHLWDDKEGYTNFVYKDYYYVKNNRKQTTLRALTGEYVEKYIGVVKDTIPKEEIFENNVRPEIRVLVDKYYKQAGETPEYQNILYLDIEVDCSDSISEPEDPKNEIISISFYTSYQKVYYTFLLNKTNEIKSDDKIFQNERLCLRVFDNEKSLLNSFINIFGDLGVTILTGWNIDYYDIPYLINRMKKIGLPYEKLSPINIVHYNKAKLYEIAGISILDYLKIYKKFNYSEEPSYTLDYIAKKNLGKGKITYTGKLSDLYKDDLNKFIEYNLTDVLLVKELDDKFKFIDLVINICHKCLSPYNFIYTSSFYIESAFLTYLKNKNLVAPGKFFDKEEEIDDENEDQNDDEALEFDLFDNDSEKEKQNNEKKFTGAYVKTPIKGLHEWVYDLDAESLYPNIIISLNISYETKIGKILNWNSKNDDFYEIEFKNKERIKIEKQRFLEKIKKSNYAIAANGVIFSLEKKGIIPEILEVWFKERKEYKELMKKFGKEKNDRMYEYYDKRQLVQKILLNSVYGVLGLKTFRLYDIDNAEAVTITGQRIVKFADKKGNEFYHKFGLPEYNDYCVASDTDSCFFTAKDFLIKKYPDLNLENTKDVIEKLLIHVQEVQKYINEGFNEFLLNEFNLRSHRIFFKQEYVARSAVFLKKKHYAQKLINREGIEINKLEIKGIEFIKSNFPREFQKFGKKILDEVLNLKKQKEINNLIVNFKNSLENKSPFDLAIPTSVKNLTKYLVDPDYNIDIFSIHKKATPVHVKASINYNWILKKLKLDTKYELIKDNDKIFWIYLKNNKYKITEIAFKDENNLADEIKDLVFNFIDTEKIYKNLFENKLIILYNALNWDFSKIESEQQINLFF